MTTKTTKKKRQTDGQTHRKKEMKWKKDRKKES